jgi:hypothetical protein
VVFDRLVTMKKLILNLLVALIPAVLCAAPASYEIIYDDNPVLAGATLIDFEDQDLEDFNTDAFTIGNITFSGHGLRIIDSFSGQYGTSGTRYLDNGATMNVGLIEMTFAQPIATFALNSGAGDYPWSVSVYGAGGGLSFTIDSSEFNNFVTNDWTNGFWGFTTQTADITKIVFAAATDDWVMIDNIMTSPVSASAIPEPSTYAAMAGALALGFVAYRRRTNAQK